MTCRSPLVVVVFLLLTMSDARVFASTTSKHKEADSFLSLYSSTVQTRRGGHSASLKGPFTDFAAASFKGELEPANGKTVGKTVKGNRGPCPVCTWVLKRFKYFYDHKMFDRLFPDVLCNRVALRFAPPPRGNKKTEAYMWCHMAYDAIKSNEPLVKSLFKNGCKTHFTNARLGAAWLTPCPWEEICSKLRNLDKQTFCLPSGSKMPAGKSGDRLYQGRQTAEQ